MDLLQEVLKGNLDGVKYQLEKESSSVNQQDDDFRTPLIHAVIDDNMSIVELLLQFGANPDIQDNNGYSPLHYAAQNYSCQTAKILLSYGAQVDLTDAYGNTPLFRAVFNSQGRPELIKLLLKHDADRNKKNQQGVSPIDLASNIANYEVSSVFESD